jgi:K+-transporting ATPase ATPase A chain
MLLFVISPSSSPGLMVGRTPEYLGKKIEAREVKLAMLAILCLPLAILGFTALAACCRRALASSPTPGRTASREILYAYTSAAGNNGSAFGGLTANTPWYNTTLGIAMLLGRFAYHRPGAGDRRLARAKKTCRPRPAPSRPMAPLFVGLLIGVILIVGGLTFFPALALGPIVEHFAMLAGQTF